MSRLSIIITVSIDHVEPAASAAAASRRRACPGRTAGRSVRRIPCRTSAGDEDSDSHAHEGHSLLTIGLPRRAEEIIGRGEDDPAQSIGITGGSAFEKSSDLGSGRGAAVTRQRGIHPALGEEDVAGPLDLAQQLQARAEYVRPTRRAADDADSRGPRAPRLAPPIRDVARRRRSVAHRRIARRAPAARTPSAPCGLDSSSARTAARGSSCGAGRRARASSCARRDEIRLRERQSGTFSFFRQTASSHASVAGVCAVSRSAENHADFRLARRRRVQSGAQHRLEPRRADARARRPDEAPVDLLQVAEHPLDVQFVRSRAAAHDGEIEQRVAGATRRPASLPTA